MKSPRDVRVGESPSLDVGWLNSGRRSEAPKKRRTIREKWPIAD
jgi:hypothetical protein